MKMSSIYRSEEICLTQLFLQSEAAFPCISKLGELGLLQFNDLNPSINSFQRKFVNEVRRCDEMERKLCFLERELKNSSFQIVDDGEVPFAPQPSEMMDMEAQFEKLETNLREMNTNEESLKLNFLELNEFKYVLMKTRQFFDESTLYQEQQQQYSLDSITQGAGDAQLLLAENTAFSQLEFVAINHTAISWIVNVFVNAVSAFFQLATVISICTPERVQACGACQDAPYVSGVILQEKVLAFERFLWRACRGNVYLRFAEIETPLEDPRAAGYYVYKCAFVIFFQGQHLKSRIQKICQGFLATLHTCPVNPQERREVTIGVTNRIADLQTILDQTCEHKKQVLSHISLHIRTWLIKVRKLKAIYHTLNLFNVDIAQKCLIGECWCPSADIPQIKDALQEATESSGSSVPSILHRIDTDKTPPTFNRSNKFTGSFQVLIDSYGVANYREINPMAFTTVTFPFLFAIMFGDLGHGILMFLFGLYLVMNEKKFSEKSDNEIWEMMFAGRYLILLMGLFSIYTGFLYNECFSRSLNVFGSAWNVSAMGYSGRLLNETDLLTLDPAVEGVFRRFSSSEGFSNSSIGNPYPIGMDPIWETALNKITFQNSYKMKAAVIVGFCQMLFGLILALTNHLYFKQKLEIFCEWIPQMLFLLAVIGYLCLLILVKWTTWTVADSNAAPSLLIGLINMFMFVRPNATEGSYPVYGDPDASAQFGVQIFIVLIAVICIPWMLLAKPLILRQRHKKKGYTRLVTHADPVINLTASGSSSLVDVHTRANDNCSDDVAMLELNAVNGASNDEEALIGDVQEGEEEFVMTEVVIHQIIHTIEYCLSCISHTASYLRLWALSLAHAELSEVLWTMVMRNGLSVVQGILGSFSTFLVFWAFAGLTVAILLVMEGLSAFLHALRLHWVEFQSKFYGGEGHEFIPFSFEKILAGSND